MDATTAKQLRRLRTLGRGASGAVVWLASDDASGELLAVKSAGAGGAAEQLRREGRVLSGLHSPHVVPCLGSCAAAGGEYQLFLEFAPRGSLADEAARTNGGCLPERAIRAYAEDVARGLAYLHGNSLVHGDVKARNVMVGADGRAKLADFGCARTPDSDLPIGGTPAFMAPEVARGEEQGPAADVWALGCTVIEMATGRAPWSDMDDVFAAVHRIGYTDAVPDVPGWLSPEAKDFLGKCLTRSPRHRSTAAQLLEHPFLATSLCDVEALPAPAKHGWTSPKSTLNAEFWESDDEDEAADMLKSAAERISSLASSCSALPDWDSDDWDWIDVHGEHSEVSETPTDMAMTAADFGAWSDALDAEVDLHFADVDSGSYLVMNVGVHDFCEYERCCSVNADSDQLVCPIITCHGSKTVALGCHCKRQRAIEFDFAQIWLFHDLASYFTFLKIQDLHVVSRIATYTIYINFENIYTST